KRCQRRTALGKALAELAQGGEFALVVMVKRHSKRSSLGVGSWTQGGVTNFPGVYGVASAFVMRASELRKKRWFVERKRIAIRGHIEAIGIRNAIFQLIIEGYVGQHFDDFA